MGEGGYKTLFDVNEQDWLLRDKSLKTRCGELEVAGSMFRRKMCAEGSDLR